jgi:hypothetical protein
MRPLVLGAVLALSALGAACNATPPAGSTESAASAAGQTPEPAWSSAGSSASGERPASDPAASRNVFTGTIAEVLNASGYTYARLTGGSDDVWIATTEIDAKVGERVSVALDLPMRDFDSRTLNRHFELVYFVTEVARDGTSLKGPAPAAGPSLMRSHGGDPSSQGPTVALVDPPAGGLRVADVFARRAALSGKQVSVRGTVVKFNAGILDRNWLHLQDGSGSAAAHDNDLTLTTDASVDVGDVVVATGTVRLDQDFGAGYAYDVMIEKATLAPSPH